MNQSNKAVILARVSSKGQEEEGYSLDSQVKLLQSYCVNKGLTVARTFKITESASKTTQRRTFKEAMKFIEDNKIKHLIIEKVDRHVRNLHDAVETHDWLMADENKQVHFVKDSLIMHKGSRSQEWLNWGIRVVMAKNYIDNLREEAMKGWAEKLAQGWLPAVPPPGYKTVVENGKRIHVPNPETKSIMQRMFKLYLEPSHSIATIREEMRLTGIVTRKGRPYSKSSVQNMLMNPFYIGTNHFNGKDYPGAQEPIISKELFSKVQLKMHNGRPTVYKKHNPIFKNIIKCGECGCIVTWQRQKGRYYGSCQRLSEACKGRSFLREDKVEELVLQKLRKLVSPSPAIIDWVTESMREKYKDNIESHEKLVTSIQAQIGRISRMDDTLYDDKLSGDISPEKYQEKHKGLMEQRAELEKQLQKADRPVSQRLEQRLVILELSQKAANLYGQKTPEQKRLIITKLFADLTFDQDSVSVTYTNFARAIADNVQKTHEVLGGTK